MAIWWRIRGSDGKNQLLNIAPPVGLYSSCALIKSRTRFAQDPEKEPGGGGSKGSARITALIVGYQLQWRLEAISAGEPPGQPSGWCPWETQQQEHLGKVLPWRRRLKGNFQALKGLAHKIWI